MIAHSFGTEEIDRHIILFKKEHAPSEEELHVLRNGEVYMYMTLIHYIVHVHDINSLYIVHYRSVHRVQVVFMIVNQDQV